MNRKKIYLIITFLAIVTISALTFAVLNHGAVVAKIGDKPIYKRDIQTRLKELEEASLIDNPDQKFDFDSMDNALKGRVVRNFIIADLIEKEAIDSNVEKESGYKKALEFTIHQLRQKIYLEKLAKSDITEGKIKKSYEQFVQNQSSKEEFKVQQILAENKDEIDNINKQISKKEADFDNLAKKYNSVEDKEDGRYFAADQMPKEFNDVIAKLSLGQISSPFKSDFGWHIIKLIDKRKSPTPSYDELKDELREKLSQEFLDSYIDGLLKKNKVTIMPEMAE